ncbi:MAG: dethiobiotin synthase [Proteobacteria bacterium]|nr:dethiobiotin synthase [Pseudomonadota bacterium]NOG60689.1 dethiobiotin synthase [Pseudomonadota bacterium]
MTQGVFIAGTDTGVGKTCFTISLIEALKNQGHAVSGMKPIASGASLKNGKLMNEDADLIMRHSGDAANYELINPVVYEMPVSPHIAAKEKGETIDLAKIIACYKKLTSDYKFIVVEGVGGWRVPVSDKSSIADMVRELNLPVILVVGLRLGCINHAILTAEAIKADGLKLLGWVSNHLDREYLCADETIKTLNAALACPQIADIQYIDNFQPMKVAKNISFSSAFPF